MPRAILIVLTAAGCLLGAFAGHQLGRNSMVADTPSPVLPAPNPSALTPSAKPPGPEELVGDLTAALRKRDRTQAEAVFKAMESLGDDALQTTLNEAKKVFNRDQRRMVMARLLAAWGKRDPDAAIEYIRDELSSREHFEFARPVFLAIIDSTSAKAGLELYHKHNLGGAGQLGISSLFPIFTRLGHDDIDAAIEASATIEGQGHRHQMIASICESSTDPAKREKLLAWAKTLPADEEQAQAFGDLIEIWARRESPDVALAWALDNALPAAAITEIEQNISTIYMTKDHQAGAEWLLARSTAENRSEQLAFAVGRWANDSPNAAGEWLGQQTLDATADKALVQFARAIEREDPESAYAWAQRITDPDRRESTIKNVMMHWRRLDPKAAAAAAAQSAP